MKPGKLPGNSSALLRRLGDWQRGSVHRRIFSAAAIVATFTLTSKVLGALREIFVARQFGTADEVDAFVMAFLLPSFAISVIGGSVIPALIPTYVEVREREGAQASQRLLSSMLALTIALLVGVAIVLALLLPALLPFMSAAFTPAKQQLTRHLTYLLVPSLVMAGMTAAWAAVLNAHGRFAPSAAASLVVPLAAIASLLALGRAWGIFALAGGTLAGYCLEAVLVGGALRRAGVSVRPRWAGWTPGMRRVIGQYLAQATGSLIMGSNPVVDQVMAGRLGPGSVAALGYGGKIEAFAIGIGVTSLSAAVLPHFSRLTAAGDWRGLEKMLRNYSAVLLVASIPVTVTLVALSEPIVHLLFERGAFTHGDTLLVSRIQAFYLASLPLRFTGLLYVRFIMAVKANRVLMWISVVNAVVNVAGNYVLSAYLGVAGIALSTAMVYAISNSLAFAYTRRRLRTLCAPAAFHAVTQVP